MKKLSVLLFIAAHASLGGVVKAPLTSLDTGHTIQKVRTAKVGKATLLIGSTYDGEILAMTYAGERKWMTSLSGFMVHDLWCADLDRDGADEILAANADGMVYCLDIHGKQRWVFRPNASIHIPPMYAVCAIRGKDRATYVVCGGFDLNLYYLSADGKLVKTLANRSYSVDEPWGADKKYGKGHFTNFLRPVPQDGGYDRLAMMGTVNHMQSSGHLYEFEPLADKPHLVKRVGRVRPIGDFRFCDPEGDGRGFYLAGTSALKDQYMVRMNPDQSENPKFALKKIGTTGYRITQVDTVRQGDDWHYFMLCGTHLLLLDADMNPASRQTFACEYSFYDIWQDHENNTMLLASCQDGGSCIHVLNLDAPDWGEAFAALNPPGKIQQMRDGAAAVRAALENFKAPAWERDPLTVYESGGVRNNRLADQISAAYNSPQFMYSLHGGVQTLDWRDHPDYGLKNDYHRNRVDKRMKRIYTQEQVVDRAVSAFEGRKGIALWAGHGNDAYYYQPETYRKILDQAGGKKTVMVWPEMNGTPQDFDFVMEDLIYPIAEYAQGRNGNIHIRNKGIFWSGLVYTQPWKRLISGEFADVFVTSMEETTDKTQDLSLAGRQGMWASGALDAWGMRNSRDNPSFDRSRQHSYQKLSNHFLRTMVYTLASGATHMQNTYFNVDTMSLAWELVAKGALYVPKREEIVSFNPVHLSMTTPDEGYLHEAESHKLSILYDRNHEEKNPMVFSRMNASWMAAPVNEWDFSRYASGVKDRRQNFLPPTPNGMVLITPPQHGPLADREAPRGKMVEHLHPLYRTIMKEVITDGRDYISNDGKKRFAANEYYTAVEDHIKKSAQLLPLTVGGDVAWVCAQTAPNHLRLTLVDSGYLNPEQRTAEIAFHTVQPLKIRDVLSGEYIDCSDPKNVSIDVPLGLFRFVDIEFQGMIGSYE